MTELARLEKDKKKRQAIDDMQLTSEEWIRVKRCLALLTVCSVYITAFLVTYLCFIYSMPTVLSSHSHQSRVQVYTLLFQLLRSFSGDGQMPNPSLITSSLSQHLKQAVIKSRNIMKRLQSRRYTRLLFVSYESTAFGIQELILLNILIVLDPSSKTEHLRRTWGKELLSQVIEQAEETVHL